MNTKRQQILSWQQSGHIDHENIEKALAVSESNHSPSAWFGFISKSILWLSILSIAFGVIFFFAYNWDEISITLKFGLIQLLMLMSLFTYTQTKTYSHANTATLFFMALLIGTLFALFGQTYQTGKDPWQLFLLWTVFVMPLALTSRSSSLWLLYLGLGNLTLNLYLNVYFGLFGLLFDFNRQILLYALFNASSAIVFEYFYASKHQLINNRIAGQVALVIAMACFSWMALFFIVESRRSGFDLFLYVLWMSAIYYLYRIKTIDVMVMASWVVSAIIFVLTVIGKVINNDFGGGTFLLFSVLIIGFSTIGIKWLMSLLKEVKQQGERS